jgi:calcineurin-like phosphoesterase
VQTADEQIFPGGTAFMCDAGMCGPVNSILGRAIDPIMNRFISNLPASFPVAGGEVRLRGALLEIEESTGRARRVTRVDEAGLTQTALPEPEPKIDIEPTPSPEET